MFGKMKLIILGVLIATVFSLNLKTLARNEVENKETSLRNKQFFDYVYDFDYYYSFEPFYYSYSPIYYTYTPTSYYYLCEWWWFPSACETTYIVWRQKELNKETDTKAKPEKRDFNVDEARKQIKDLKKEIFGKEDYVTEDIRKNHKVYDPRWLLAQLKISRILFLEDEVRARKAGLRTATDAIKVEKKTEEKEKEKDD